MNEIQELREASRRIRKTLGASAGESAANDLADLLDSLIDRVGKLERNKVDVIPIVPMQSPPLGMQTVE